MEGKIAHYFVKNKSLLNDKFRGCLVGALVGDCLGSLFENAFLVDPAELKSHFDRTERNEGVYGLSDSEITDR